VFRPLATESLRDPGVAAVGNWYKNITTRGPSQAEVVEALLRLGRRAYVTPTRDGITVVFDDSSDVNGDPTELGDLALSLSANLSCPSLAAAVFDDDVLLLGLYEKGTQVGEYNSSGTSTLSPAALARAFQVPHRASFVWLLMKWPRLPVFIFESFRHRLLIRALRQPVWAFATGYNYIAQGEPPEDLDPAQLMHVGASAPGVH
jgi:hypothetical protein